MKRSHILIVEDDALIAKGLAVELGKSGIVNTRIALSGQACLDAIHEERPDLVILDIEMPGGMDGIETAGRIKSDYGIPFIYLTAYSNESLVDRAKETAPYGFILKPYRPNELVIAIEMALHRHEMEQRVRESNARLEREIEERRRADEALRESEERYRTLIEASPDSICVVDKNERYVILNDATAIIMGMPKEQILGNRLTDLVPGIEETDLYHELERASKDTRGGRVVNEFMHRDGQTSWFEVIVTPVPEGILCISRDITERRRAEQALRESEEKYRDMVEQINDVIFKIRKDGTILFVSGAVRQLFGYSPAEIEGRNFTEIVYEDDIEKVFGEFGDVLTGSLYPGEYRVKSASGQIRWVRSSSRPFYEKGEPAGIQGVLSDISLRRWAEEELRNSHERLVATLDALPDLMFEFDIEGRIHDFRAPDKDLLYLPPEMFLGKKMGDLLPEDAHRIIRDAIAEAAATGKHHGAVYSLALKDGLRWFELSIAATGSPDSPDFRLIALSRDVTERVRADEALAASERRYRLLYENAPIGIFTTSSRGRMLAVNIALARMLGLSSPEEVISRYTDLGVQLYKNPDRREEFLRLMIDNGSVEGFEFDARTSDGRAVWFNMNARISGRGDSGEFLIEGFAFDITDRKATEKALQESERKYRELVENSNSIILRMDKNGIVTFLNEFAETFFGYRREEIIGRSAIGMIVPETESTGRDLTGMIMNIVNDPDRYRYNDNENMKKNGDRVWVAWTNKVIQEDRDHAVEILCIGTDITEQRQAAEALRQINQVVEASPAILFRWKASPGWPLELVTNNVTQFGYASEELMSGTVLFISLMHPADRERVVQEVRAYSESGAESFSQEYRIVTRDGGVRWVDDRTVVERTAAGRVTGFQGILIDITERKVAEEEVLRSEQKFRELYENLREGSVEVDLDGKFVQCNNRYLDMAGYAPEDVGRLSIRDVTPEQYRQMELKILEEQVSVRGYSEIYEKDLLRKDGTTIPVELQAYLKKGPDGMPTGYWALVRDISRRKRAETELVRSEKKYRELADFMPEIIFEVDRRGSVTYINRAVFPLLGYTMTEIERVNVLDLFVPEDRDRCRDNFMAIRREEIKGGSEYTMLKKDGGRLPVILYIRAIRIDGEFRGARGVVADITEMRRMETALRESEAKFHSLFSDSGDAQILIRNWMILDCNNAAAKLLGCAGREDLIGRKFVDFCPEVQPDGESSAAKGERVSVQAKTEKSIRFEWQHRRTDGTLFYAEVVVTQMFIERKRVIHATLRDVTERRLLQDQIISIVDVEQQRLGRNLHDGLGQDLTGVAFLCNSLARRLKELGLEEAARSEEITAQVYRVITLVRTLSRELYPPNLVENEITYTLADFAANIEKTFGITCIFDQDRDLVITNLNASTQIYYVTREAVNNAIRHGKAHNILIKLTKEADRVILIIKDDGAGLPEEKGGSPGLGLKIMAYRMESIHGTFGIRRDTGGGTVITCSMPVYMTKEAE